MSEKNDGGYVYPIADWDLEHEISARGITRRDWLAGLAMQGLLAHPKFNEAINVIAAENGIDDNEYLALAVYQIADAMIAEGNK